MSKHLLDDLNDNALSTEEEQFLVAYGIDRHAEAVDEALAIRLTLRSRAASIGTSLSEDSLDALTSALLAG